MMLRVGSLAAFAVLLLSVCGQPEDVPEVVVLQANRKLAWKTNNANEGPSNVQPEQIHLAYSGDPSKYTVTWITFEDPGTSFVEYGQSELFGVQAAAQITRFRESIFHAYRFVHRAEIRDIQPGKKYYYRVGSEYGFSNVFSFTGLQPRQEGGYRFLVYGDFGLKNARSLGRVQNYTQFGEFDMALHVGDFAYDMQNDFANRGDEFFRQIEPIAARIPYMALPGNHEASSNFTQYRNRFTMPGNTEGIFYSFDVGQVHFVAFSTEIYYSYNADDQLKAQFNWLKEDLTAANRNRAQVPWIVAMGHRPMYCTTFDILFSECNSADVRFRVGMGKNKDYALEPLFFNQGVDLIVEGHEHNYERLYPIYNQKLYKGTSDALNPNNNPGAPIHVITGSAGCQENIDSFTPAADYDAARSTNYGFSTMHVFNSTHLLWQQIRASDGVVEDTFLLVKNSHGPFTEQK
ncbi:Purple acid phosphatase [Aphelenchoides fujianensis]|nr:Purple acid phosphatase [Aphelenchoides fujianensis]